MTALEFIALDEATPQLRAPGAGDTYVAPRAVNFIDTITGTYLTASQLLATDGSKAIVSLTTATYPSLTELSYVKGVTSAIQTQLNSKAPTASPTFTVSITGSYLTANEILASDGSKNIVSLTTATYPSLTELSYVKGLTSAVQTQLNGKQADNANLTAIAGLTSAADKGIQFTGSGTAATYDLTTAGKALLDDANAAAQRTTLGATTVGSNIFTVTNPGSVAWIKIQADNTVSTRSASQTRTDLGLVIGTDVAAAGANTDITALDQDVTITESGTIAANTLGFRGLPTTAQSQGSGITLALADAGKAVPNTTGGWTIPANGTIAFPVGTTIVLINNSGSSQNCAITSDTLRLAGTASTGTRAIAQYGIATLYKATTTSWIISGAGVS